MFRQSPLLPGQPASAGHPASRAFVKKLLALVFSAAGSAIGWWIGAHVGIMTAFVVSMVGVGVGIWGGARLAKRLVG